MMEVSAWGCRGVGVSECPCWVTPRRQHSSPEGCCPVPGQILSAVFCYGASYLPSPVSEHLHHTCSTQISITSTGLLFGTFKKALQSLIIHPEQVWNMYIIYLPTHASYNMQYASYHTYLISTIKICFDQSTISWTLTWQTKRDNSNYINCNQKKGKCEN